MKQSPRNRRIQRLSIVFASLPFAFGLVRAVQTGDDFRYLWVAVGSQLGAIAVMAGGRAYSNRHLAAVALSAAGFVAATLLALLTGLMLGSRVGLGILVVAAAFGFCSAAGCLLYTLARSRMA